MTSVEKAETALNRRLERLQANLRGATAEEARRSLAQALLVAIGLGGALSDYVRAIGEFARRRHDRIKQSNDALIAQHAALLESGQTLLAQLKATPTDRELRREIDRRQREMTSIHKTLRRGAGALQRDIAPSIALVEELSGGVRRFAEAGEPDTLRRAVASVIACAEEIYRAQPDLPARGIIDAAAWQRTAAAEIQAAPEFHAAFALGGYQALRAIEAMTLAVAENAPADQAELAARSNAAVVARLQSVAARFNSS
jgi:hypothetical protein